MCRHPLSPCLVACLVACLPADPRLVPGGGAVEMAVSRGLAERANSGAVEGVEQVRPVLLLLVWQAGRQGAGCTVEFAAQSLGLPPAQRQPCLQKHLPLPLPYFPPACPSPLPAPCRAPTAQWARRWR